MFGAITRTQWKWTRGWALLATLAGFLIPVMSVQMARSSLEHADYFVSSMQSWGVIYSVLAGGAGLLVALSAWGHDHRGRHIYALTLPIPRWKYALMRFGAGALFLLGPVAGVLAGTLVVAAALPVPAGLHVYPLAVTLRFAFAAGVAYSLLFAVSSATPKAAGIVLGALGAVLLAQVGLSMISVQYDLIGHVMSFVFDPPGILSVFSGRWMLVDV